MNYKILQVNQKSEEWFALREGLITGSVAKKVLTKGNDFLYEVLAAMTTVTAQNNISSQPMQWGIDNEADARELYTKTTGNKLEEIGFVQRDKYGLSPDGGMFRKDGSIKRTVEIKCPETKNHIRYIITNKIPAEHLAQVVHNFIVIDDLEQVDFISYDPRYKYKPLHIIPVTREALILEINAAEVAYQKHLEQLDEAYRKLIL